MRNFLAVVALTTCSMLLQAAAVRPGIVTSNAGTLPANDDGSTSAITLNIDGAGGLNFFGANTTTVFVNNNGNVTFQTPLAQYTPNGLATGVGQPIIAPFFADVDTRGTGSGLVNYGNGTLNGRAAFIVNWPAVGYYSIMVDKLNTFQLILTDRSDTGAGNFDIEYNYDSVQWETGSASRGAGGLGGTSVAVGYSNGQSGAGNVYYQLPGSLVNGALINGGANALIANSLNSGGVLGRYDFQVRGGQVVPPTPSTPPPPSGVPEPASMTLLGSGLAGLVFWKSRRK